MGHERHLRRLMRGVVRPWSTLVGRYRRRCARTDALTGLASRTALEPAVARLLASQAARPALAPRSAVRSTVGSADGSEPSSADGSVEDGETGADPARTAVLVLDLDGFHQVNAALGHEAGDRVLVEVARRVAAAAHRDEIVARLGGDELAMVVPNLPGVFAARHRAAAVAEALATPITVGDLPLDISASIGVAVHPDHGSDFSTLLRHAEVAMYDAKLRGDRVAVYAPASDHHTPQRLRLLADLRRELEANSGSEIGLYYQPQVEIATGAVVGVEALLRWRHPQRGLVDPEELMRVAEHSVVMRMLTRRVVDDVIDTLAGWDGVASTVRVSVNVSVRDLYTWEIADRVQERLSRAGVAPGRLQLEITESALMADPHRVLATLTRLRRLGVGIALDDFGTGYSSMLHLRRLPLSEVKVDRSFVLGLASDAGDAAIVRTVIALARALNLRVVAEGVEDERTWRLLAEAGCDVAQGWFFGRPMPADQLLSWLSRYRPRPARTG